MKHVNPNVLSIAFREKDLCARSGTCVAACPTGAISVGDDFYPKLNADLCTECGLCAKLCPGGKVSYSELTKVTFGHSDVAPSFDGHVTNTFVGYAADPAIRQGGAGGGVITALLWDLLRRGVVDGCIVTRMDPKKPWVGEAFIARTYEDLLQSQQSKYIVIPLNSILAKVRGLSGRFALAALPCHIHGFRLLAEEEPVWKERIYVVIGLFCASAMEPYVALEMLEARGVRHGDIKDFQFRGGAWPGYIRAVTKDGEVRHLHRSNFKDGAINYLTYLYSPIRCQLCIDGSAEFADISVSDAWTRDEVGKYVFESQSRLLVRTGKGLEVLKGAIAAGTLVANDVSQNRAYVTHKLHTRKKGFNTPIRVERLRRSGKPVPVYDRKPSNVTLVDILNERVESFIMALGRHRITRFPLFKFLTSRYGVPFIKIRQFIKSRRYRKK